MLQVLRLVFVHASSWVSLQKSLMEALHVSDLRLITDHKKKYFEANNNNNNNNNNNCLCVWLCDYKQQKRNHAGSIVVFPVGAKQCMRVNTEGN